MFLTLLAWAGAVYAQDDVIITDVSSTPVTCGGGSDGTLTVSVTGGVGKYTYLLVGSGIAQEGAGPIDASTFTFTGHKKLRNYIIIVSDESEETMDGFAFGDIYGPDPISITSANSTNIICNNEINGSISVSAIGEQGSYIFDLTGPQNETNETGSFNGLPEGDYTVTVSDKFGCPLTATTQILTILNPSPILVNVDEVTDVDCFGEATGAIDIRASGGVPPYSFNWTGPGGYTGSTADISNLKAGDYSLTLTDAGGCVMVFNNLASVSTNTAISATFNITNITCKGQGDGAIQSNISGGTPPYTYSWVGPFGFSSPDKDISGLRAGVYLLTVTDALDCKQLMSPQFLTEPPPITATATRMNVDCYGAGNGSINLSASGGVAPYLFAWTGPNGFTADTEDLSGLEPGAYSVAITDAAGCTIPFPSIATILEPSEISAIPVIRDISCAGSNDGSIDISVSGGVQPYNFDWSGPGGFTSGSQNLAGLGPGSYDLVVTDGNGCMMDFPGIATITDPAPISAILTSKTDILCNGAEDASITIDVSGGTGLLLFSWTNQAGQIVSTDEDPLDLPAGRYSLNIRDENGCSIDYPDLVTVSEPPPLISSLLETHVSCYGNDDGSISVTSTGGSGSYEYSINGNLDPSYQPANTFSALGPGFYTIWTRDANLCVISDTLTILEPAEIQIAEEVVGGPILCKGDATGSISINGVSGGVGPYQYSINSGGDYYPGNQFNNLVAGDYQVMVMDATGCEIIGGLLTLTEPEALYIDSYAQSNVSSCSDAPEGNISITAGGGSGTRTYQLNGGVSNSSGNFQFLPSGSYLIHISDLNGCSLDTSVLILGPAPIVVDNLSLTDITSCSGDADGGININGSGGTGNISYSLDGGAYQASGNFGGLLAGSHTITLRDDNACTLDTMVALTEPAPIVITSELLTQITCAGAANGAIEILASGGTNPLEFTLNPGGTTNLTGRFGLLGPGSYTVEVNDAEGCGPVFSSLLTLANPPVFNLDSASYGDISCFGADNGSIDVFVSGGIPPYQYSVDNQTSWLSESSVEGLGPGTYEVYARDANLCTLYAGAFSMTDPAELVISVSVTDIANCSGDTSGAIDITGSGGTGLLLYSINGTDFQGAGTFINLAAGAYTAHLLDEAGCSVTQAVTITEPDPVVATILKTDATFGNLGSINFTETTGGTEPYEYTIGGSGGSFSTETFYDNLEVGTYHAFARDAMGCTYEEIVNILDVLPLDVVVNVSNVSCFGESDGSIEMLPQDAEGAVEYSIDSGATFVPNAFFEMLAGNTTYHLVARDAAGKVFTGSVDIAEPSEISLSRTITPAECNAFSETGGIQISIGGGTPGYTYLWSDGSTLEDRNGHPCRKLFTDHHRCQQLQALRHHVCEQPCNC